MPPSRSPSCSVPQPSVWACLQQTATGVVVALHAQPRSSRNQIVGLKGDLLKVKLTSPPVEGAANKCCCDFLAKTFGLAKRDVSIVGGDRARHKRVLLEGLDLAEVSAVLTGLVDS
jgi:uncharacterized protein (TIGR00251 family)